MLTNAVTGVRGQSKVRCVDYDKIGTWRLHTVLAYGLTRDVTAAYLIDTTGHSALADLRNLENAPRLVERTTPQSGAEAIPLKRCVATLAFAESFLPS